MSEYKHGAYASIEPTQDFISPKGASTLPVYIGRASVNQLAEGQVPVNTPILITSYNDAVKKIGYSDNWKDFELNEAVYAHFKNGMGSIGPIVVINALNYVKPIAPQNRSDSKTAKTITEEPTAPQNQSAHLANTETTKSVTISKGKGEIATSTAVISTVSIAGKVVGTDFSVNYSADGLKLYIADLKGTLSSPVEVKYFEVEPASVTSEEIIEAIAKGLPLVYQQYNMIPTLLCSPHWSSQVSVHNALCEAAQKINGHWYAFVNSDLPANATINTIDKAIAEKKDKGYSNALSAVCYPMAKKGDRLYHLSVIATYTMQMVDFTNNNLPYETPSNKQIDITGLCLEDGTAINFDQTEANRLNAEGIRTASFWGGKHVLWGSHTAKFVYGQEIDPKDQFDCSVRMLQYLANDFQLQYGNLVDKPMRRALVDTIINDCQAKLDSYKQQGALLSGDIRFDEKSNEPSDLAEGDFIFDIATTTAPPAKSITAKIIYNKDGLATLFGGETE